MTSAPVTPNILSRRQNDVLKLIVQGRSNREIARALNLAEDTVEIHVAALFRKLGVNQRTALAVETGWLELPDRLLARQLA